MTDCYESCEHYNPLTVDSCANSGCSLECLDCPYSTEDYNMDDYYNALMGIPNY